MKRLGSGIAAQEMFPYNRPFTCPNCAEKFQLEVGDQWDVGTDGHSCMYAITECPNPDCGSRIWLMSEGDEAVAKPPKRSTEARPVRRRPVPAEFADDDDELAEFDRATGGTGVIDQVAGVEKKEHGRGG